MSTNPDGWADNVGGQCQRAYTGPEALTFFFTLFEKHLMHTHFDYVYACGAQRPEKGMGPLEL